MNSFSKTEEIIMELLIEHGELYGLDMVHKSAHLKRGTVYVTLNRMEDKQLVTSKLLEPPNGERGPARRVYSVTNSGKQFFHAWQQFRSSTYGLGF